MRITSRVIMVASEEALLRSDVARYKLIYLYKASFPHNRSHYKILMRKYFTERKI